jgi:hypothetical protein
MSGRLRAESQGKNGLIGYELKLQRTYTFMESPLSIESFHLGRFPMRSLCSTKPRLARPLDLSR